MNLQLFLTFLFLVNTSFIQAKTIVYLNGGPGFISIGHEAFFWDEPSDLRPRIEQIAVNAFELATDDAHSFIKKICDNKYAAHLPCELTLVAHSFAVHHAVRLVEKNANSIKELILISPVINIEASDKNILQLAVKGLVDEGHLDVSAQLSALIPTLGEAFDNSKMQAYILASQYASLFVNYWTDLNLMQQYFSFLKGDFSFDPNGFFAVRASMPAVNKDPSFKIPIPTHIYFGAADPVAVSDQQLPLLKKYFTTFDTHILGGTKHYPHIERLLDIKY